MKQTFTLPDYLTIKGWMDWHEVEKDNSLYYKIFTISCVTGKSIDEIKSLPVSILPELFGECAKILSEESMSALMIKYKGKTLGFAPPHLGTIGEVAEIEQMIKSDKPYNILKLLFREVEVDNTDLEWQNLGEDIDVKWMVDFDNQYKKYTTKKYDFDSLKDSELGNDEFWDDFPAHIYTSVVGFIAGVGMSSSITMQLYSKSEEVQPEQLNLLSQRVSLISDGLRRFLTLRKLTFSPLQEIAA